MSNNRSTRRTIPQHAERSGLSEDMIREGVRRKALRAFQPNGPGGRIYITDADFEEWLNRPVASVDDDEDDVLRVLPNGTRVVTGVLPVQFPEDETEPLPGGGYIVPGSVPVGFPED